MLHTLKITNVALIDELTINFKNSLNVLTGETGAGKSIILDSLNFLLGARADKTLIRSGKTDAKVVGVFSLEKENDTVNAFFEKLGLIKEDNIIISRQMNINGKSITQVNGEFVTASMLKELTSYLIDIHGQNEHQFILNTLHQLQLVDNFDENAILPIKLSYKEALRNLTNVNEKLALFGGSEEERLRQIDLLTFEVDEIEKASLIIEEDTHLLEEFKKLQNIEKITSAINLASSSLDSFGGSSVVANLSGAIHSLNTVSEYDNNIKETVNRIESAKLELEDIVYELNTMSQNFEFNQEEYDKLDERLEEIKRLKRKYGGSIENVLTYLNDTKIKLEELSTSKERFELLQKEKQSILKQLLLEGTKLHNVRVEVAQKLVKAVLEELYDLGMPNAKLQIEFNALTNLENLEKNALSSGLDSIEFYFSANLGEPVKPLNKIISGGEMSRFMLAVKTVAMNKNDMETMIFDEIDAGISGKMAQAVSKKLAKISRNHQVIVVSHLPQISAMADYHYYIEKVIVNDKTLTKVKEIENEERIDEIARMLSAEKLTDASKTNARTLKTECEEYKFSLQ